LRLATLIVDLALSFDSVAPVNDDGHRHDDNKERHGGSHQHAQQRCHLEVQSVTCTEKPIRSKFTTAFPYAVYS
jgi:hypothetical protein